MAKKKTGAFLPHEEMMERFRKEGRVTRTEISLKALKVDHRLQAREKPLDLDNVKELHGYVKDGLTLAPIVVFRVDGKDYVANGFHRVAVHKREGLAGILADVVEGTWQEAVEYSTCCNMANHALQPTSDDKKKAVFMLLDNGWVGRSISEIATHVGMGADTIAKWRVEWCEKKGVPIPKTIVTRNGKTQRASNLKHGELPAIRLDSGGYGRQALFAGKTTRLPRDASKAKAELQKLVDRRAASLSAYKDVGSIVVFLAYRDIYFDSTASKTHGLSGGVCRGLAATYISEDLRSTNVAVAAKAIALAVGRVVLIAEHCGLARKVVFVHDPIEGHEIIVSLARRLGVEFMTLEQFVEAVKADEGEAGAVASV